MTVSTFLSLVTRSVTMPSVMMLTTGRYPAATMSAVNKVEVKSPTVPRVPVTLRTNAPMEMRVGNITNGIVLVGSCHALLNLFHHSPYTCSARLGSPCAPSALAERSVPTVVSLDELVSNSSRSWSPPTLRNTSSRDVMVTPYPAIWSAFRLASSPSNSVPKDPESANGSTKTRLAALLSLATNAALGTTSCTNFNAPTTVGCAASALASMLCATPLSSKVARLPCSMVATTLYPDPNWCFRKLELPSHCSSPRLMIPMRSPNTSASSM
mmetsp:Transcript_67824/g.133068  ORF Transcript_67824/g.133068 Transcript_67824/m.133068 type:complete len:269 (+) Transcript_67824:2040-2846(+)